MSIAIIRAGGKQFSVEKGATVRVPSLKQEVGASIELEMLAALGYTFGRRSESLCYGRRPRPGTQNHRVQEEAPQAL